MPEPSDNMETSKSSLEFRASIIPYDTYEDLNAPILASSGDNINLIFNIPKEKFRKLAIAAIAHLDSHSNFEKAGTSNGIKESDDNKLKRYSEKQKFRLSDVVSSLENENTKDIIDSYEDINTPESSKNKDVGSADPKLCVNDNGSNGSFEVCDKSVLNDETEKLTQNDDREELNDQNLDLSDCPELENAWPDVHPFTETEKIPTEEIESLVFNGFVTKYLKLELSNEFVMIKVTSKSDVVVDVVKYKETGKESTLETGDSENSHAVNEHNLSGKETNGLVINADISQDIQTVVSNENVDSIDETVSLDENETGERTNVNFSCVSKAECATTASGDLSIVPEILEPKNNFEIGLEESTTANDRRSAEDSSNRSIKTSENLSSESLKSISSDILSLESFENAGFGEINLKIEEKLEELNSNVLGSSPTERLKFTLRESLTISSSEVDSEETEETVANIAKFLSEHSDSKNTSESDNFKIHEKCLKEDSLDECVTESSETCHSNEMTVECSETTYFYKESNTERESPKTASENNSISPEKTRIYNSSNKESVNEDSTAVGKYDLNDHNYTGENSLNEEPNMGRKSFSKPVEQKDSLEDSDLDKDLHLSEDDEVLNDCSKLEDMECKEAGSQDMSASISCKIEENESMETNFNEMPDNAVNCTSQNNHDLRNEQCEQAVEENCQAELVTDSRNLENFENSLAEIISEEKSISENQSTDDSTSAENCHESNAGFKNGLGDESKDYKVKAENAPENLATDANIEGTLNEASDPERSKAYSKSFEKECLEQSSEYLEDSVSETTDIEEKLPENSFASNADSFMDTTVDANVESASEYGDFESDDVKSVASESDDSRDSDKHSRRNGFKNRETDEVDCAPTRTRRKAVPGLSKDAIPENTELKSTKFSNRRTSTLDTPSKSSGRISPVGRSLRSKSLDPTPEQSKRNLYDKKHSSIVESEELPRRTRAKTPDVIGKRDIKTTARSSPRKLGRSSATTEQSSTSKVQSTKTSVAESKSRANPDSMSTKRSKRGSKE